MAGPAYGFENEPVGWFGAEWGTEFDKMPARIKDKLTLKSEHPERKLKIYNIDLSVVKSPTGTREIGLSFFEGKFSAVLMDLGNEKDLTKFVFEAMSVFGEYVIDTSNGLIIAYWLGETTTIVTMSTGTSKYNAITIGSTSGLIAYGLTDPENQSKDKGPVREEEEANKVST